MQKEKKKIWRFSKMNKFYIFPFLVPVFCMFTHLLQEMQFENINYDYGKYQLPTLIHNFVSKCLSILIWKISIKKSKSEIDKRKLLRVYHYKVEGEEKEIKVYVYIFIVSFLEVVFKIEDFLFKYLSIKKVISGELIEKKIGFIILIPILTALILKKKLYRHHVVSIIVSFIGCIFVFAGQLLNDDSPLEYKKLQYQIIHLFFSSTFTLSLVLTKHLMIKYFIFPFQFLFLDGLFCLINSFISIFFLGIFFYIFEGENYFWYIIDNFKFFFTFQDIHFFTYIFFIVFSFVYYCFNILSLFYFSPYINILTDFISPFLLSNIKIIVLIIDSLINTGSFYIPYKKFRVAYDSIFCTFIGFLIVYFGSLILNEVVIFNCFGLNEGTFDDICDRSVKDLTQSNSIFNMNNIDIFSEDSEDDIEEEPANQNK